MRPSERENRQSPESHCVLEGNALYEIDDECMKRKAEGQRFAGKSRRSRKYHK